MDNELPPWNVRRPEYSGREDSLMSLPLSERFGRLGQRECDWLAPEYGDLAIRFDSGDMYTNPHPFVQYWSLQDRMNGTSDRLFSRPFRLGQLYHENLVDEQSLDMIEDVPLEICVDDDHEVERIVRVVVYEDKPSVSYDMTDQINQEHCHGKKNRQENEKEESKDVRQAGDQRSHNSKEQEETNLNKPSTGPSNSNKRKSSRRQDRRRRAKIDVGPKSVEEKSTYPLLPEDCQSRSVDTNENSQATCQTSKPGGPGPSPSVRALRENQCFKERPHTKSSAAKKKRTQQDVVCWEEKSVANNEAKTTDFLGSFFNSMDSDIARPTFGSPKKMLKYDEPIKNVTSTVDFLGPHHNSMETDIGMERNATFEIPKKKVEYDGNNVTVDFLGPPHNSMETDIGRDTNVTFEIPKKKVKYDGHINKEEDMGKSEVENDYFEVPLDIPPYSSSSIIEDSISDHISFNDDFDPEESGEMIILGQDENELAETEISDPVCYETYVDNILEQMETEEESPMIPLDPVQGYVIDPRTPSKTSKQGSLGVLKWNLETEMAEKEPPVVPKSTRLEMPVNSNRDVTKKRPHQEDPHVDIVFASPPKKRPATDVGFKPVKMTLPIPNLPDVAYTEPSVGEDVGLPLGKPTSEPQKKSKKPKYHTRTLLMGKGVRARVIPLIPLHLVSPVDSRGANRIPPTDPRIPLYRHRREIEREREILMVDSLLESDF